MFDAVAKALARGAREAGIDQDQKARIARRVAEAISAHYSRTPTETQKFIETATSDEVSI